MGVYMKFLEGYKSYMIAAALAVTTFLYSIGKIDFHTFSAISGFLGSGGLATIRSAIVSNSDPQMATKQ